MSSKYGAPQSRNEAILQNALGENNPIGEPQSRNEALLQDLVEAIQAGGGGTASPWQPDNPYPHEDEQTESES